MPTNTKALQVAEPVAQIAGKNAVINGGFDIWQRGTSFSLAASTTTTTYTTDRWATRTGANQACTVSRQATSDTTNLPNIQYCLRYQRNSGQTGTGALTFLQNVESINSIPFAGKSVTISFYARAGANYSATSSALAVTLWSGTGTDQDAFGGLTNAAQVCSVTATLTTTWQRFTATGTVASNATQLNPQIVFTPTGTASTNDYYEITGVQLELGNTATPFSRAGGDIQGELAKCQRYYIRLTADNNYTLFASGDNYSTTQCSGLIQLPVQLRTTPSSIETTGTASNYRVASGAASVACSSVPALDLTGNRQIGINAYVASGLTAGYGGRIGANNTTAAYIGISAEL